MMLAASNALTFMTDSVWKFTKKYHKFLPLLPAEKTPQQVRDEMNKILEPLRQQIEQEKQEKKKSNVIEEKFYDTSLDEFANCVKKSGKIAKALSHDMFCLHSAPPTNRSHHRAQRERRHHKSHLEVLQVSCVQLLVQSWRCASPTRLKSLVHRV